MYATGSGIEPIAVNVVEIDPENGEVIAGGLQGSVVLNADATNPVPADPDLNSFFETHDPIVVSGALSSFANPNFFNPNFFNPNFFNPNFFNPNFFNPNFFNTTLTELEWEVQNSGNAASTYSFSALNASIPEDAVAVQLVVTKLSVDPAENFDSLGNLDCALGQLTTEEIVLDIFNPNFLNPNFFNPNFFNPNFFNPNFFNPNFLNTVLDPGTANASFALSPGEVARISLRVLHNLDPSLIAGADVASHAGNTLAPFAVTSGAATAEDTPVIIDFLVNVTDPDGDPVEFVGASALNGSAALNVFGQLVYTPNLHFNGTDTLVYTVSDDNGDGTSDGTADGLVVIDVTPVNDDPTAVDDPGVVVEAGSVGNLIAVLNNDSDAPDSGETLTVIATSAGSAGGVALPAAGGVTYTPVSSYAGPETFTYTIDDNNGGSAVATVTVDVVDTAPPEIGTNPNLLLEATGSDGATAIYDLPIASDAVGIASVTCVAPSGSVFPLGASDVICTATDLSGLSSESTFTVTVEDTIVPAVVAPLSITVEAEGVLTSATTAAIAAFLTSATAADVVDGDLTGAVNHNAPADFGLGATLITFSATDAAGNTGATGATVTVEDTTLPAVVAPLSIAVEAEGVLTSATTAAIAAFLTSATAADVVDGDLTGAVNHNAPADFGLGATLVTFSATDAAGNTGAADATVTVVDTTPPDVDALPNVAVDADSPDGTVVNFVLPAANDIVDPAVVAACVPASGSLFSLGETTVTCSATDASGNTGESNFTVTIIDPTPPVVIVSVSPENLWPPNGDMVPITVTGSAVDSDSGVDQVTYEVIDEYGLLDQPSTLVLLDGNGNFVPFTVFLEASRRGNDQDGRTYIIRVTAESGGGSAFSFDQNVNVHDQGPDQ